MHCVFHIIESFSLLYICWLCVLNGWSVGTLELLFYAHFLSVCSASIAAIHWYSWGNCFSIIVFTSSSHFWGHMSKSSTKASLAKLIQSTSMQNKVSDRCMYRLLFRLVGLMVKQSTQTCSTISVQTFGREKVCLHLRHLRCTCGEWNAAQPECYGEFDQRWI